MSLQSIYPKYSSPDRGGDKGTAHTYIDIYATDIKPGIEALLEVGVWEGQSLAMWEEYLPGTRVIGLDNDMSRLKYDVDCRHADATSRESVDDALLEQMFDVIIDDGSHAVHDQIASFDILWPRLKKNGIYFIEDVNGPDALRILRLHLERQDVNFIVYDNRAVKNRHDDILIEVLK